MNLAIRNIGPMSLTVCCLLMASPIGCGNVVSIKQDGGGAKDSGVQTDISRPAICDEKCWRVSPTYCVRLPQDGTCVGCTNDSHCQQNPYAHGGSCLGAPSYTCGCASDSECSGKTFGQKCDTTLFPTGTCACTSDADCNPPGKCIYPYNYIMLCQIPCQQDQDCKLKSSPMCNRSTGVCVECMIDKDCTSTQTPYCDTTYGVCAACLSNSDCPITQPHCDPVFRDCNECRTDQDCLTNPTKKRCFGGSCTAP